MNTAGAKIPISKNDGNWQSIDIYLFSNGQYSPPRKYHLRAQELNQWDATLSYLARLHYGIQHPMIYLYTTDGHIIEGPLELKDGAAYVAVEPTELFIEAGYEKYLIKASRSWEKRQLKKTSPQDMTGTPNRACEHQQPCCLCPEREVCAKDQPCCICPEKEDIINCLDDSEQSVLALEKCAEDCCPFEDDYEHDVNESKVESAERGAIMAENNKKTGDNGQWTSSYERKRNEYDNILDDTKSRISELITRLNESEPWSTDYHRKSDNHETKIDNDTKICDRRVVKSGQYRQWPREFEDKINEHTRKPENVPDANESRFSELKPTSIDSGSMLECNTSKTDFKISNGGTIPGEKPFKAIDYVQRPIDYIAKPSEIETKTEYEYTYGHRSVPHETRVNEGYPKNIEHANTLPQEYECKNGIDTQKNIGYGHKSDLVPRIIENGQSKSANGRLKAGENRPKMSEYGRRPVDRGLKISKIRDNGPKMNQSGRGYSNRAMKTDEVKAIMPQQEPISEITDHELIINESKPRTIETEVFAGKFEDKIIEQTLMSEDRGTRSNELESRMDGYPPTTVNNETLIDISRSVEYETTNTISRPSGNDVRAAENGEGEIKCYKRPYEQERPDEVLSKTTENERISIESRKISVSYEGKPYENRGRLNQQGVRPGTGGIGAPVGYAYVSEAQQHVRKSSISTSRPSMDSKKYVPNGQHPTVKKPSSGISPLLKRKLEDKKIIKDSKYIAAPKIAGRYPAKMVNGAAFNNGAAKPKTIQKYQNKTIPPAVPQQPSTMVDKHVMKTIATSPTEIISTNKFQSIDTAFPLETIIDTNTVSTNLFRNPESEITSLRFNSNTKPLFDRNKNPSPETRTYQTVLENSSQNICNTLVNTVPNTKEYQMHSEQFTGHINKQGNAVTTTKQVTRASSQVRISRSPSGTRNNVVPPNDPDDENYIAIINKGDVVNLKLNIEVRNAEKTFSSSKTKKSRSLTNITTTEKGSQISIEEEIVVHTKSLQSLLNQECIRGSGFECRPKVLIVQCACCGQRTNIPPRFDPTTTPTSTYDDGRNYLSVMPCSQNEDMNRCNPSPLTKKCCGSSATPKKATSITSVQTLTIQETHNIETLTNSTCQTENVQNDNLVTRRRVSITEDQKTSCDLPRAPSSCREPKPSCPQKVPSCQQNVPSCQQLMPAISITRCTTSADADTQTQWCNILLEARRHENGRYSFHLPPLQVLRHYKPSENN